MRLQQCYRKHIKERSTETHRKSSRKAWKYVTESISKNEVLKRIRSPVPAVSFLLQKAYQRTKYWNGVLRGFLPPDQIVTESISKNEVLKHDDWVCERITVKSYRKHIKERSTETSPRHHSGFLGSCYRKHIKERSTETRGSREKVTL